MTQQLRSLVQAYAKIDEQEWNQVQGLIKSIKVKKGEAFLNVGDQSDYFAIVEEGLFRIFYVDIEGKEAIKTFRSAGGVIGAYAEFLRGIPSRLCVEALTDSFISVVSAKDMLEVFKRSAQWEKIGRKITEQLYLEKEEREYQFLCLDAGARYKAFLRDYPGQEHKIPDYMVASYLGITPVYLSKLKKSEAKL